MQIYAINNPTQNTIDYVCNSQATIDAGQTAGYIGAFSIGTESDATAILAANQQSWLIIQSGLFNVNEKITVDAGIQWEAVDLSTQPANTDLVYALLNVPNGDWITETGLIPAQTTFATIQQNYLAFSGLSTLTVWTEWKPLPKPSAKATIS
jgi:hypothetical protein